MYSAYFAIEKRLRNMGIDADRKELVAAFTSGEKNSLRALTHTEYRNFLTFLSKRFDLDHRQDWQNTPENKMRRKIIGLFIHHMGYTREHLDEWCIKYGKFGKPLQAHTRKELVVLVSQAEGVYKSHIQSI